jgi:hypothetical protein
MSRRDIVSFSENVSPGVNLQKLFAKRTKMQNFHVRDSGGLNTGPRETEFIFALEASTDRCWAGPSARKPFRFLPSYAAVT